MKTAFFVIFCGLAFSALRAEKSGGGTVGGERPLDPGHYLCEEIKRPFFAEVKPGSGQFKAQRSLALPERFSMPKPAGVKRVFILGESVALILGQGEAALYGEADGRLPLERIAGGVSSSGGNNSGFEIINCGMGGYDSFRIHGILREVLNYQPDLLVILSGNNEVPAAELCPGPGSGLRRREFRLLEKYYSLKDDPQQAREKASLKMHGAMLEKMAKAAKKAGVPAIFCTLPANLKDLPSYLVYPPLENPGFAAGYKLFYEREYEAAAEKFRLGPGDRPAGHFFNFYLGKTLEKLGRTAESRAHFLKAVGLDDNMGRASEARNALIKRVAGSEGACVADLEGLFYKLSPGGLPGFREFTDEVHWRSSYNKAVWDEIFRSAAACGIKAAAGFKAVDSPKYVTSPRADASKRFSYAFSWLSDTDSRLNEGSLAALSYLRQNTPGLFAQAAGSPEALGELLIHNSWSTATAARLRALFPLFLVHLAETERRLGNSGAALSLCERGLSLKPADERFRLVRAQILAGSGRLKEAEKEFRGSGLRQEARALGRAYGFALPSPVAGPAQNTAARPVQKTASEPVEKNGLESLMALCIAPAGKLEPQKALQACQSVVYTVNSGARKKGGGLAAAGSDASFESYKLLKALGRAEEAKEALRWTVANSPASWPKLAEARGLLLKQAP